MLTIFVLFYIVSCVHIISIALAAKALDVTIKQVSFGFGKKLFSFKTVSFSLIPLGGFVKLADSRYEDVGVQEKAFNKQPLWKQLFIPLCGPLLTFIVALICLGNQAFDDLIGTFSEAYYGAISPLDQAQEYLSKAELFINESTIIVSFGVIAAKITALNLLPFSGTIGGQTVFTLINRGRVQRPFEEKLFQVFFYPFFLLFLIWSIALVYWLW